MSDFPTTKHNSNCFIRIENILDELSAITLSMNGKMLSDDHGTPSAFELVL